MEAEVVAPLRRIGVLQRKRNRPSADGREILERDGEVTWRMKEGNMGQKKLTASGSVFGKPETGPAQVVLCLMFLLSRRPRTETISELGATFGRAALLIEFVNLCRGGCCFLFVGCLCWTGTFGGRLLCDANGTLTLIAEVLRRLPRFRPMFD